MFILLERFPTNFCFKLTEMAFNHSALVYLCGPHSLLLLSCKIIQSFLLFMQINSTISLLYTTHRWLEIWGKGLTMLCIWPHQSHPDLITALCEIFHVSIECSNFELAFSKDEITALNYFHYLLSCWLFAETYMQPYPNTSNSFWVVYLVDFNTGCPHTHPGLTFTVVCPRRPAWKLLMRPEAASIALGISAGEGGTSSTLA